MRFKFISDWDICGFKKNEVYETLEDCYLPGFYKFKKDNTYYDEEFVTKNFVEYNPNVEFHNKLLEILE